MFRVDFRVRQGSVLSPHLFAIYMDDLVQLGQFNRGMFIILYADDIMLIAPSTRGAIQIHGRGVYTRGGEWCEIHHGENWGDVFMIMMLLLVSVIIYYYINTFITLSDLDSSDLARPLYVCVRGTGTETPDCGS